MWGTFGPQIQCNTQKIWLGKYVEYQEKRAFRCLRARADIPSGVQKYPKTTK